MLMEIAIICLSLLLASAILAAHSLPDNSRHLQIDPNSAAKEVYKRVDGIELNIYIFKPPGHQAIDRRPAVVFFHGGGWLHGSSQQFFPQCEYLAARGIVAMSADYRVKTRDNATPYDCVADAKSAVRWIRKNATRLGIDPRRIAASGGSAGGHLAAAAGVVPGFDEIGEDIRVSSIPDALVLFNPPLVLAPYKNFYPANLAKYKERIGEHPEQISPIHCITSNCPPTIIFHGEEDQLVPIETVSMYANAAKSSGNRCELVTFPNCGHGFFNFRPEATNEMFYETMTRTLQFLTSLGWLSED
ncbi:alpha/beta hydrolase [candidate division KSB1 bacterium]|nr:alpha/beta hydrolase [candidate division KSB1 bacterium]